jgi:photosystem II biogenesis protein Psp29
MTLSLFKFFSVSTVRTVSDTKRTFYTHYTRPITALYRRFVEELMVEMHLLLVNTDFRYDPVLALGFMTAFEQFMHAYQPETEQEAILNALCEALAISAQHYRSDAQNIQQFAQRFEISTLVDWLSQRQIPPGVEDIQGSLQAIAANPRFKYSRIFAIGLLRLLETANPDISQKPQELNELLTTIGTGLKLPVDKILKDLDLYRSNLEKISQARSVMEDILQAERKRREQQAQGSQEESGSHPEMVTIQLDV